MFRLAIVGNALVLLVGTAYAHPDRTSVLVIPGDWLGAWSWEPGIVIPILIAAFLYAIGSARVRARNCQHPAIDNWQRISFWAGWSVLVLSLDSPLHKLGEVLFSAHMTQHELLMVVAAPLIVFSRPLIAFLFSIPESWRVRLGALANAGIFARSWRTLTAPLVVWALHGITIWAWHIPAWYQATLDDELIHALQHVCFLGTALLFWWTLVNGRYGKLGYGVAFLYVFTTAVHTSILGALMTFAQRVWYPIYNGRTALWNLSPIEDQQLGGLIMWIPSGIVFVVVGLAMFGAWLGESERRQKLSKFAAFVDAEGRHAD